MSKVWFISGSSRGLGRSIAEAALRADSPVRMLVGPDSVEYAAKAAEALAESDCRWRDRLSSAA